MLPSVSEASASLREAISDAARGLVERESLVEMIALSAVAGEHMLVVGPPGGAGTSLVSHLPPTIRLAETGRAMQQMTRNESTRPVLCNIVLSSFHQSPMRWRLRWRKPFINLRGSSER